MSVTLFKGGISKVEIDDNVGFSSATEIPGIKKDSKITLATDVDEDANGTAASAGKKATIELMSEDMTQAGWLAEVIAAEEARTPYFVRITGIKTSQTIILKNCKLYTDLVPAEAGKMFRRKIYGTGYADTEANLLALSV
jgi:hypothetical protein